MSIGYNPKIVTDSLQICLDWGNTKCYSGSGTTFSNLISSSRNNGYIKNSVSYSANNGGILITSGGNSGVANAVGDRIDINTSAAGVDRFGKTNNFSIFFMTYHVSGAGKIFSTGSAGTGTGNSDNCIWQMWMDKDQFFWWDSVGGATNNITCNCIRTSNVWQFVGFTYSYNASGNNVLRTYINGVQQNSTSISNATHSAIDRSSESSLQWTLGGGYASSCINSNSQNYFGNFVLYNKTLSESEIKQNFNAIRSRFGI